MVIVGDILKINNNEYAVLATNYVDGINYIFTNKLATEEKGTQEFYIFEVENGNVIIVDEPDKLNMLLPKFKEDVKDLIEQNFA